MPREAINPNVERKHWGLYLYGLFNGTFYKLKIVDHFNVKRAKQEFRQHVRDEEAKTNLSRKE